jgi:hypothetical protein
LWSVGVQLCELHIVVVVVGRRTAL